MELNFQTSLTNLSQRDEANLNIDKHSKKGCVSEVGNIHVWVDLQLSSEGELTRLLCTCRLTGTIFKTYGMNSGFLLITFVEI